MLLELILGISSVITGKWIGDLFIRFLKWNVNSEINETVITID